MNLSGGRATKPQLVDAKIHRDKLRGPIRDLGHAVGTNVPSTLEDIDWAFVAVSLLAIRTLSTMPRQASRIWGSSRRPLWLRRAEAISSNAYLKSALVLIAVTAAAAGGKRPIASGLANLSLDQFLSVPADRVAILQVVLLIALMLVAARVGRTIETQRRALDELQMRISQLADQCEELRHRLAAARIDSVRAHDSFLHDFGLNLRDGPMRLVEEALGELNSLDWDHEAALASYARIRFALEDALAALRATSADLAVTELKEPSAKA